MNMREIFVRIHIVVAFNLRSKSEPRYIDIDVQNRQIFYCSSFRLQVFAARISYPSTIDLVCTNGLGRSCLVKMDSEAKAQTELKDFNNIFSLDGKVAVVTGGSRGLGLHAASGFVILLPRSPIFLSARL